MVVIIFIITIIIVIIISTFFPCQMIGCVSHDTCMMATFRSPLLKSARVGPHSGGAATYHFLQGLPRDTQQLGF